MSIYLNNVYNSSSMEKSVSQSLLSSIRCRVPSLQHLCCKFLADNIYSCDSLEGNSSLFAFATKIAMLTFT